MYSCYLLTLSDGDLLFLCSQKHVHILSLMTFVNPMLDYQMVAHFHRSSILNRKYVVLSFVICFCSLNMLFHQKMCAIQYMIDFMSFYLRINVRSLQLTVNAWMCLNLLILLSCKVICDYKLVIQFIFFGNGNGIWLIDDGFGQHFINFCF